MLNEHQERRLEEYKKRKAEKEAKKLAEKEAKAKKNMETIKDKPVDWDNTTTSTQSTVQTTTPEPAAPASPPPPVPPTNSSAGFNPFTDNTENRAYTKPTGSEPIPDIPEPKVTPTGNVGATTEEPKIVNPAMAKATEEEQNLGAEQLADACLLAYEKLHGVAKFFTKVKEEKITQLGIEDKINPNLQIQTGKDDGSTITIGEFVTAFNKGVDEALDYDKSFNDKVKPPMVRVFKKHNWGLTDEQTLLIAFGQDIAEKTAICMGLNKSINGVLEILMKQHAASKPPAPAPEEPAQRGKDPVVHDAEIAFSWSNSTESSLLIADWF